MSKLRISPDLAIPEDAITQTFSILAKRGVGKTYTSAVMTEEMLKVGSQVVVVDPIGVWWGLRAAANGKDPGLPIIVMGGDHGDVPLEASAGKVIADFVVDTGQSVVLDLSLLRKGEQTRFVMEFGESLYHRNRRPLHLVLDEADAFAPQRPQHGQERMLGAVEDLVRRGRARGIGVTLVTQRAAVLNKDVLTQTEVLITLRTIAPQDRDAIDAWIKVHGTPKQREALMDSLPSLPIGTAWFWSPGWLDIFKRVKVRARETFDSSATPKTGERPKAPKQMADVDLDALKKRIASTIEKAKADDPRELRKTIAELQAQLRKAPTAAPAEGKIKRVEVPVVKDSQIKQLETLYRNMSDEAERHGRAMIKMWERQANEVKGIRDLVASMSRQTRGASPATVITTPAEAWRRPAIAKVPRPAAAAAADGLTGPQQAILDTVAMLNVRGIRPERASVARWLDIHPNGGSYGTNLGFLRSNDYLDGFLLTDTGQSAARAQETGLEAALAALPDEPKRNIIRALLEAGRPLTREELAEKLGIHPNGGSYGTNLGRLRTMGLITERGPIAVTEALHR